MKVFANPYHCLDGKGRLAGACPEAEQPRPGGGMPARRYIGARREMVEGSHVKDDMEAGIPGHGDVFFTFSAEPVDVFAEGTIAHFYLDRFNHEELFSVEGSGPPLDKLAAARAKLIAHHVAAYGEEPTTSFWQEQFPLDTAVEAAMNAAKAEAEKQAKDAEKKAADAKAKAETEAAARADAAAQAAADLARQSQVPPLVALSGTDKEGK